MSLNRFSDVQVYMPLKCPINLFFIPTIRLLFIVSGVYIALDQINENKSIT
jgi:hypothetical protein